MAKRRKTSGSVAGYFRQVFDAHPEWLKEKSNDPILAQYRVDHGMAADAPVEKNVKANLANLKSVLRKKSRRRGRRAAVATNAAIAVMAAPVEIPTLGGHPFEVLEEMIDDCLTQAKNLDRDALDDVISLLRRARNAVVWKIGE
jgi:hypothetical protein